MVHSGIRRDSLPGCGYTVWQDAGEFTFTTDSVFVAAFAHLVTKAQVLELGSGTGAISLFLAARGAAKVTGLEFNSRVTELMRRSIADNNLQDVVSVIDGDVREINKYFKTESMDLVIANPPYRNSGNTRKIGWQTGYKRYHRKPGLLPLLTPERGIFCKYVNIYIFPYRKNYA